jgi:D-beta-D-heptose 7-phosphate kinase/D-beta-D-heptose 1-phosphate adenosyltransferase
MGLFDVDVLEESEQLILTPQLPGLLRQVAPQIVIIGASTLPRSSVPGGAAGVAARLAGLGAAAELLSVCGNDLEGVRLRKRLVEHGVDTSGLVVEAGRRTPVHGRASVGLGSIQSSTARALLIGLADRARGADGVLVVDDDTGAAADELCRLVAAQRDDLPALLVNTQDVRSWAVTRPDLMVLTATGAAGAHNHLVRLEDGGSVLLMERQPPYRTWVTSSRTSHAAATAEGFLAAFALGMIGGLPPATSAEFAQAAADVTGTLPGSLVCTTTALSSRLADRCGTILRPSDLHSLVNRHRSAGRRVVTSCGTFDLLHGNEIRPLQDARQHGDVLVVAVLSDEAARRLTGHRPLQSAADRAAAVAMLSCVDHVIITN